MSQATHCIPWDESCTICNPEDAPATPPVAPRCLDCGAEESHRCHTVDPEFLNTHPFRPPAADDEECGYCGAPRSAHDRAHSFYVSRPAVPAPPVAPGEGEPPKRSELEAMYHLGFKRGLAAGQRDAIASPPTGREDVQLLDRTYTLAAHGESLPLTGRQLLSNMAFAEDHPAAPPLGEPETAPGLTFFPSAASYNEIVELHRLRRELADLRKRLAAGYEPMPEDGTLDTVLLAAAIARVDGDHFALGNWVGATGEDVEYGLCELVKLLATRRSATPETP